MMFTMFFYTFFMVFFLAHSCFTPGHTQEQEGDSKKIEHIPSPSEKETKGLIKNLTLQGHHRRSPYTIQGKNAYHKDENYILMIDVTATWHHRQGKILATSDRGKVIESLIILEDNVHIKHKGYHVFSPYVQCHQKTSEVLGTGPAVLKFDQGYIKNPQGFQLKNSILTLKGPITGQWNSIHANDAQ